MVTVKRGSVTGHKVINPGIVNIAEYVLLYAKDQAVWNGKEAYAERAQDKRYNTVGLNHDNNHSEWRFVPLLEAGASEHSNQQLPIRFLLWALYPVKLQRHTSLAAGPRD